MPPAATENTHYEGKPCVHGHGTLRYRAGGSCVVCSKARSGAAWRSGRKKRAAYDPAYRRERNLLANFGMTHEDYERMLAGQGGVCAICGGENNDPQRRYFAVDHDHATGKVRQILCHTCNVGLGAFQDSPSLLKKAAAYLREHGRI